MCPYIWQVIRQNRKAGHTGYFPPPGGFGLVATDGLHSPARPHPHQTPRLQQDNAVSSSLNFTYTLFLIISQPIKGGGVVSLNSLTLIFLSIKSEKN